MLRRSGHGHVSPGLYLNSVSRCGAQDTSLIMLADTLRTFQDFAGLDSGSANCRAVLTDAGQDGDVYLVGVAALWIFLRLQDSRHAMSREQLHSIIKAGGGAMLTVNTATREGAGSFSSMKCRDGRRW